MTEYFDRDLAALDQIEDILEAYADARLSPSGPVLARMRAQVLREASLRQAMVAANERTASIDVMRRRFVIPHLYFPRRAFALGMAAAMTLGTGAAVLAAPPGSPFYNARVAIEVAFLPAQVDQRLASHEMHLDERLVEAEKAAARGDLVALAAALDAYRAEVDATVGDVGDDADRLAHLEAVLATHVATLEALAARLTNDTAADNALEHAIDVSQKAADKLKDKGSQSGKPTQEPGGKPSAKPDGQNQQGR